jgi:hypothetical protein
VAADGDKRGHGKHDRDKPSRVLIIMLDQARPDTIELRQARHRRQGGEAGEALAPKVGGMGLAVPG